MSTSTTFTFTAEMTIAAREALAATVKVGDIIVAPYGESTDTKGYLAAAEMTVLEVKPAVGHCAAKALCRRNDIPTLIVLVIGGSVSNARRIGASWPSVEDAASSMDF